MDLKCGILTLWLLVFTFSVQSQALYGTEWIGEGQAYVKFTVNKTGVYRISYKDLHESDASFLSRNPANWQVFFRGKEVAIRLVGLQNGLFEEQSYLEFYGEKNDGSQDSLLYRPQKRPHPYQTLYSDQSAYFLTFNQTVVGKRVAVYDGSAQGLVPEKYHLQEVVQAFTSDYSFNNLKGIEPFLQQSYFEPHENWTGNMLTADSVGKVTFTLADHLPTTGPIQVEGLVNGRDNAPHQIQVQLEDELPLASLRILGFLSQTFRSTLLPGLLPKNQLTLLFKPERNGAANQFSISYVKVTYPQGFNLSGQTGRVFHLSAGQRQTALVPLQNTPPSAFVYDITDPINCRFLPLKNTGDQVQIVVDGMNQNRKILLASQVLKPMKIESVRLRKSYPAEMDYLILTHGSLKQSAIAYADYRASVEGGAHKPLVVEVDSLFDAFNYGERSPLAIRRFADFMLHSSSVKNLLLLGKANSYPYFVKTATDDLVPTMGYPGSDILLTAGLQGFSQNTPAIPTGRLNVQSNEQVLTYLAKVKRLEGATSNGLWRKQLVHISGGKSENEAESLKSAMHGLETIFENGLLGGEVKSFSKSNPYELVEPVNLAPTVNEGVSLLTFLGHAGPAITDMNFGFASAPQNGFRNSHYPMMIFNGCGVGEIFSRFNTLSTDWLLAPEKGAALVLAHSYYSYETSTARYLTKLYKTLFDNPATWGLAFGRIQQLVNAELDNEGVNLYDTSVLLQMVLQGDPALVMYPLNSPDFSLSPDGMYIQAVVRGSTLKNSDSIQVVVPLTNLGRFEPDQSVAVSLRMIGKKISDQVIHFDSFRYRDTLKINIPNDGMLQKIELRIDPDEQIAELSRDNNTGVLDVDWSIASVGSSYPVNVLPDDVSPVLSVLVNDAVQQNNVLLGPNPELTIELFDENPLSVLDADAVEIFIAPCETCEPEKILSERLTVQRISTNHIQFKTTLTLDEGGTYHLLVFGKDAAGNRTQPPYTLILQVAGTNEPFSFESYPNPASSYVRFELNLPTLDLPAEAILTIYSVLGIPVFEGPLPVRTGKNRILWQAQTPGLYPFRLQLNWQDGRSERRSGNVLWQD
ncbi:putative type IX secretion system sortase PorU2 [Arundinibacter roseus]|uniref:Gingipain domain-containing protein n=1 Tax=Arundinibacter roseus TaxID=2070510 RepID=A0A4R4KLL6_9BACT|nr:C25 family cysteine peptidase [Arundinibacter roseus]TDB67501.1 hypothetical protein EZE20_06030 [Arundinibacter roseus]